MTRSVELAQLRERDGQGLLALERELQENLFALKIQKTTGQLENTAKLGTTRRALARVKTLLRARALGLEHQVAAGAKTAVPEHVAAEKVRPSDGALPRVLSKKSAPGKKAPGKSGAMKEARVKTAAGKRNRAAAAGRPKSVGTTMGSARKSTRGSSRRGT